MIERPRKLSDARLLDLVQRQTFRYFWDFAHPVSGLARERSHVADPRDLDTVTSGGSGFGVMAIIIASERGWIDRQEAVAQLLKMTRFLERAASYHGVFPHWLDGATGRTVPFSRKDDGGDLVETSFLIAGLLCARQYFRGDNRAEGELRQRIESLWRDVEWSWHLRDNANVLYWHWSPNNGWSMNHEIRGWNECLITYVLAASSPSFPVSAQVYHRGWANGRNFKNGRRYYDIDLALGPDYGGPLFFAHYSFLGLDPRGLVDSYADYWAQNVAHTLINREHAIRNPLGHKGYGADCWGLTASDNYEWYNAHSPTKDLGVIAPTAALSSFPYTPEFSMAALRHFYGRLGDRLWGEYGFKDAFSEDKAWVDKSYLAIDQGPIIIMIENHLTGLMWDLFMSCSEVREGLARLGFASPRFTA
jgi:hypothetical protein